MCSCSEHHKDSAPGWHVACDGKGHFAPQTDASGFSIARDYDGKLMTSQQRAIDRGWEQYEYETNNVTQELSETIEQESFHECGD